MEKEGEEEGDVADTSLLQSVPELMEVHLGCSPLPLPTAASVVPSGAISIHISQSGRPELRGVESLSKDTWPQSRQLNISHPGRSVRIVREGLGSPAGRYKAKPPFSKKK